MSRRLPYKNVIYSHDIKKKNGKTHTYGPHSLHTTQPLYLYEILTLLAQDYMFNQDNNVGCTFGAVAKNMTYVDPQNSI